MPVCFSGVKSFLSCYCVYFRKTACILMIMVTIKGTEEFTEKWKETWASCLFSVFLASLYFSAWCVYALLLAAYSSFPLGPWRPTNLRQSGRGHADACGGIEDGAFLSWSSKLTHCSLWRWITAGFPPSYHTTIALTATSGWPGTVLFRVVSMGRLRTIRVSQRQRWASGPDFRAESLSALQTWAWIISD